MATLSDCPTFINLAAFAAAAPEAPGADPFGADRRLVPLRTAPVEVGSIRLGAGAGTVAAAAGDLFLVAASGEVTLTSAIGTVRLTAGESCVIAADTAFEWAAPGAAALVFMRHVAGAGAAPGIVPIAADAELAPSGAPLAQLLVGETPSCRNHTTFRSADGEFTSGVWDSTPYHRRAMRYGHFELMVLLRGAVTFVDELEQAGTFGAGDIFLIEQGASCSWDSREDVAKIYAIYRPLA